MSQSGAVSRRASPKHVPVKGSGVGVEAPGYHLTEHAPGGFTQDWFTHNIYREPASVTREVGAPGCERTLPFHAGRPITDTTVHRAPAAAAEGARRNVPAPRATLRTRCARSAARTKEAAPLRSHEGGACMPYGVGGKSTGGGRVKKNSQRRGGGARQGRIKDSGVEGPGYEVCEGVQAGEKATLRTSSSKERGLVCLDVRGLPLTRRTSRRAKGAP